MYVGKKPKVLCLFRSPASGGGEVEGKGRLQAVAEGVACGGEAGQEGLGLLYQLRQAAAKGRGAEGEFGMGFQLQKAQFSFVLKGERILSLGIVFHRVAAFPAYGREGSMPGLEGFPFGLQVFQQVKEAFLGFQGVGASVRMQEFELVLQLGNIRSNGHHFVFALWKRGNMPPPLSGGVLRSFFFAAPKKNEPKRRGPRAGKELGLWPQTAFPEAGDTENGIFTIHKVQRIYARKAGKRIRSLASDCVSRGRKRWLYLLFII